MTSEQDLDHVVGRVALTGLDARAKARLRTIGPVLRASAPGAVDALHARLRDSPDTARYFTSDAQMLRLALLQVEHLRALVEDDIDRSFVARCHSVGAAHHRAGVSPSLYLGACAAMLDAQVVGLFAGVGERAMARDTSADLLGAMLLDAGIVLDAYELEMERAHAIPPSPPGTEAPPPARAGGTGGGAADAPSPGRWTSTTGLTTADVEWRRRFLGIDRTVVEHLHSMAPLAVASLPSVLDDFYELLTANDHFAGSIDIPVERLLVQTRDFWHETLTGAFDRPYAASRVRVGVVHERVGVSSQLYLAGLARMAGGVVRALPADHPDLLAWIGALVRAICFDATFVVDAYMDSRAERLLRTEGFANQLVRSMADAVVVVDARDRVESANERILRYVRVDAGLLHRMPLASALPIAGLAALVEQARSNEPHAVMLAEHEGRALRVSAVRLDANDTGRRGGVAVVLSDVTDLLSASGELRESQDRLDHLLRSVSATLWEVDLSARAVDFMTSPVADLTGYPDSHFFGRLDAWMQLVHPADLPRLRRLMRGLEPGGMAELEHRIIRADGEEVLVRTNLRRLDERPRIAGVTLDVRELQEERVRRQGAIGDLAGGVAHELNNALSAVYGHLAMVGRIVHDPRAQRSIAAAEGAAARAADITARLLSFAGRQSLEPVSVDLNDVVGEVVPDGHWPGAEVMVEHRLAGDLGECVVDRERVASAIGELVVNALEAMSGRGSLVVSTCNVRGQHGEPDYVEVSVADTGRGMDAETLARAVEPFFTTKELGESSGLGLSTVFGFVTQSDGLLLLESIEGAGTIVRMRFPLDRSAAVEETISIRLDSSDVRVLVVDDDVMVREVTAQILSTLGLRVVAAGSADAALEVAQGTSFDFLVTDLALGAGADGARLIELLRSRRPDLGVVVMSGYPMSQLPFERLRGPFEYVAKPFTVDAIGRALRAAGWAGPRPG